MGKSFSRLAVKSVGRRVVFKDENPNLKKQIEKVYVN